MTVTFSEGQETMDDLPDQTDPEFDSALVDQVAEALYARDREPDYMDPEYDWANIDTGYDWSDEDQSPTDDYRAAARIALGAVTSVLGISSLRARLAQAEADLTDANRMVGALGSQGVDALERAKSAEAALARVAKLCDAAIDRRKRLSSADGYNEISLRGAADLATNVLAALVVADTGEGLSKTSAKPLVVADTRPSIDKVKCRICDAGMLIEHSQAHMRAHLDSGFDPERPNEVDWDASAACQHGQASDGCRLCAGIRERQPALIAAEVTTREELLAEISRLRLDLPLLLASGIAEASTERFPFDRLRMQKAVFMVAMRGTPALRTLYSFVPYNWGPYSGTLSADVNDLIRDDEVAVKPAPRSQYGRYETTYLGEEHASRVWASLSDVEKSFLRSVRSYVTNRSFNELLREVYAAYPQFAEKSKFSG